MRHDPNSGTFQFRGNRDARARELAAQYGRKNVHVSSMRNQNLHPMYVDDYDGLLDTGFGNSQYRTFWSRLYMVEVRHTTH